MKDTFRCLIAGGRNFNDYPLLRSICNDNLNAYTKLFDKIEIVSGGAIGTDKLGERFAKERLYHVRQFLPDWATYGKGAGIIRNEEMAKYADACIIFWDGKSNGTASMIRLAKKHDCTILWLHYFSQTNNQLL